MSLMMSNAVFTFAEGDNEIKVEFTVGFTSTVISVDDGGPERIGFIYERLKGYNKKGSAKIVHGRANPNQTNARYWIKKFKEKQDESSSRK